jgi:hypothetical protein
VGSLGKVNTLASENPLPQLRLRGLDLTHQVAPGASFPLSVQSMVPVLTGFPKPKRLTMREGRAALRALLDLPPSEKG